MTVEFCKTTLPEPGSKPILEVSKLYLALMNIPDNKKLMENIFIELSNGNDRLFIDAMADEIQWIWMGSSQWSKTFHGKTEVLGNLWSAVRQTLKPPYKIIANNIMADGDYVTVEATGQNSTPNGGVYHNKYCWVCRIVGGKIYELKEYMDTDLVTKTFTEVPVKTIGEKFLFDFGMNKAIIHFLSTDAMQFTIIEKAGTSYEESEKVEIKLTTIRPNVYLATWKEKNGNTITQVQDFLNNIVYSNWTLPSGEFINVNGTIRAVDL
jgi:ketosteroid isomerase-like protein